MKLVAGLLQPTKWKREWMAVWKWDSSEQYKWDPYAEWGRNYS